VAASHVETALAAEEARAFTLAMRVRVVVLLVVGAWLGIEQPARAVLFQWTFVGGFLVLGAIPLWLRRRGRWGGWWPWVFPALDAALLATVALLPNPLDTVQVPIAQRLRFGNEVYFFALIAFSTFTYSPRLVLWQGVTSALAWTAGGLIALTTGDTFTVIARARWRAMTPAHVVALIADPNFVPFPRIARPPVLFLLVAGTLATLVWRARRLVVREAEAERARTNLARYFSANMVEELAAADAPFAGSRAQDCAVLFADVVGFTRLAAGVPPERVIAFLREYHARMERAVFDHAGTLDKYVGDGVMATFGTPVPGTDDAVRALRCARAMLAAIDDWNGIRAAAGDAPVRVGIGLAYGPVVLGDIGGPHRFEFAVLGDTVNVASRLERLARTLGGPIVASDDLVRAVRAHADAPEADRLLAGLVPAPGRGLRGREDAPLDLWVGPGTAAVTTPSAGPA
jgi:adenylate cyclase